MFVTLWVWQFYFKLIRPIWWKPVRICPIANLQVDDEPQLIWQLLTLCQLRFTAQRIQLRASWLVSCRSRTFATHSCPSINPRCKTRRWMNDVMGAGCHREPCRTFFIPESISILVSNGKDPCLYPHIEDVTDVLLLQCRWGGTMIWIRPLSRWKFLKIAAH